MPEAVEMAGEIIHATAHAIDGIEQFAGGKTDARLVGRELSDTQQDRRGKSLVADGRVRFRIVIVRSRGKWE